MKFINLIVLILGALIMTKLVGQDVDVASDNYQWLEEVEGAKALDWVRAQNQRSTKLLEADPLYQEDYKKILTIFEDKERIPYGSLRNGYVYNFWRDEKHIRGVWRRSKLSSYQSNTPKWEVLLDVDSLAKTENENWIYQGAQCLAPDHNRCLVTLSRGGKDAAVLREFDVATKSFVKGGYELPEAKSRVSWLDRDTLLVATNFGEGSLTDSGYPRILKVWKRGTPISSASVLMEGVKSDVSISSEQIARPKGKVNLVQRRTGFYSSKKWMLTEDLKLVPIEFPDDADLVDFDGTHLFLSLRETWTPKQELITGEKSILAGSVVAVKVSQLTLEKPSEFQLQVVFTPDEKSSIQDVAVNKNRLLISLINNVKGEVLEVTQTTSKQGIKWISKRIKLPENGAVSVVASDADSDDAMFRYENFLIPESLFLSRKLGQEPKAIKSRKKQYDASSLVSEQFEAVSKDGTKVPYFVVRNKKLKFDGRNPTYLYAYGGFEISMTPSYLANLGDGWLNRNGIYVVANIRGGGEFGPKWHQAALKENRFRAFEDFFAVAEDLMSRKITSKDYLAIGGGSNGGLLMGVALTQRPDLFKAVACSVPLLDMMRYTKLLAGASWAAEYGDPENADMRKYILTYSPYHNLKSDTQYPEILFLTSTKDDRVHPGHARKMAAKMEGMKKSFLLYENIEGGHGGAANFEQAARRTAYLLSFFRQKLKPN